MPTTRGRGARRRSIEWLAAFGASVLLGAPAAAPAAEPAKGPAILHELRSFNTLGSVLYIAAHPDDENTHVITYLARGRGYRTAYLSLTRGDGGQNLLGPQLGDALGVARTEELLAARRIDGGRQYFTRARDFGYSKDYRETLRIWGEQAVLGDVVRVIRAFRPDVIITRFSPEPGETHGHHTASAVLALEAFRLAGDPHAFPEQLGELTPWQPKRIFHNRGGPMGSAAPVPDGPGVIRVDVAGTTPGEPFASIAARSRGMHKTQGFGMDGPGGGLSGDVPRIEGFLPLAGELASRDLLDGVDTTWGRIPGGAEIARMTEEAIARFHPETPSASVPALLAIRRRVSRLPPSPVVSDKRRQLDEIVQSCLGLEVETVVDRAEVVPGETVKLRHTATLGSSVRVRWLAVRYPTNHQAVTGAIDLRRNRPVVREASRTLPATAQPTQPYWLRREGTPGLFEVDDPSLIGQPQSPPVFPIEYVFETGGQVLVIPGEPVPAADAGIPGARRRLEIIPPVAVRFASAVDLFAPGTARPVTVELTAARPHVAGAVRLAAPRDWTISPPSQPFQLSAAGDRAHATFTVTAPPRADTAPLEASLEIDGARFNQQRVEVRYDHIPFQILHPPAIGKAVSLDLAVRGRRVGYLPGAGDDVAECLERMGYAVTPLTGADLTPDALHALDAVVIGVRAFNTRTDLTPNLPALFAYVEAGGTVVAQYNQRDKLADNWLAPFQLRISRRRITDERSPVTILAADHPALTSPNRIAGTDFDGWVQERGLYFPDQWDARFTPVLASSDPGEAPLRGGLLVARHGKGYFVYTALSWFRQLPAGVPGAYRLFANLVSLGK